MAYGRRVRFEELRRLPFGSIVAGYSALGGATSHYTRMLVLFNSTDVDVDISLDGTMAVICLAAGSGQIFDFTANEVPDDGFFIDEGTVIYVKRTSGAPSKGNVWAEVVYAAGGV